MIFTRKNILGFVKKNKTKTKNNYYENCRTYKSKQIRVTQKKVNFEYLFFIENKINNKYKTYFIHGLVTSRDSTKQI